MCHQEFDLLLRGGTVVTAEESFAADIGVQGGKIAGIGELSGCRARKILNAAGKYVLPGVIDGHMHVEAPMGGVISADDFYTQSISAAFGGVTTFMDFTNTNRGDHQLEKLKERREQMKKSAVDYAIHGRVVEGTDDVLEQLTALAEAGCPSFKMYMTYKEDGFMISEEEMARVFQRAKEINALCLVHCETDSLCRYFAEQARGQPPVWALHGKTRPLLCEADAASRAINLAKAVGNSLLLVHTTSGEALRLAKEAQRAGYPIYVETCPHYLTAFEEIYDTPDGHLAICSPPLRTEKEAKELWEGMEQGVISLTGSDDCAFTRQAKECRLQRDENGRLLPDYRRVVSGCSGIEVRLPLLLTEGVSKKRITINQLAALTSTNLARLFGMYPQKGCIACGSDADLVLVDLEAEYQISQRSLHNRVGYTIFEGRKGKGRPVATVLRGRVLVEDGRFLGEKYGGRFVARRPAPELFRAFGL